VGGDIGSGSKLDARYSVVDYTQDLSGFGPAVRVSRKAEGEDASEFWLFRKYPNFDRKHRAARVSLSLKEERPAYLTGLQVTHDPGSIPVFAGAVLLMIGLVAVFYMSHRQVWIRIGGGRIQLAASASRNAGAMDRRVGSLKDELEREIGCT
jgi:cytochrome c biogenesis protein